VFDKVVCERWRVTKLCVKESVCDKGVCERWGVTKLCVKGVCERECVCDKVECETCTSKIGEHHMTHQVNSQLHTVEE
jgi:hypothetical protein